MASITREAVKEISCLERTEGRDKLLECIGWEDFDEEDDAQKALQLDYFYDILMFTVKHGFPWEQCCHFLTFSADMLDQTKGKTLTEAIIIYKKSAAHYSHNVSEQNLKTFTDLFFDSFMKHYKLYQYVFNERRNSLLTQMSLAVDTPAETISMTQGKSLSIWDYEEKLKEIETKEKLRCEERVSDEEKIKADDASMMIAVHEQIQDTDPVERKVIEELINNVATAHLTTASHEISSRLISTMESLEFMLEKTSLPRPQELGPPPRYGNKPTLNSGGKRPKSQGTERVKSKTSRAGSRIK